MEEQENKEKTSYVNKKAIIATVTVLLIFFIALFIGIIVLSKNDDKNSKSNNSNESISSINDKENDEENEEDNDMDIEYDKEYIIEEAGMKFIPTDDLMMLSGENLKTYYGEEIYEAYNMIATNEDMTITICCFTNEDEDKKDYTEKEFLENTLSDADYDEIEAKTIDGFEFQVAKLDFEDDYGDKYTEYCYVYKVDDKFICFDYCYPENETNQFDKMIKKQ